MKSVLKTIFAAIAAFSIIGCISSSHRIRSDQMVHESIISVKSFSINVKPKWKSSTISKPNSYVTFINRNDGYFTGMEFQGIIIDDSLLDKDTSIIIRDFLLGYSYNEIRRQYEDDDLRNMSKTTEHEFMLKQLDSRPAWIFSYRRFSSYSQRHIWVYLYSPINSKRNLFIVGKYWDEVEKESLSPKRPRFIEDFEDMLKSIVPNKDFLKEFR